MWLIRVFMATMRWLRNLIPEQFAEIQITEPVWSVSSAVPTSGQDTTEEASQLQLLGFYPVEVTEPGVRKYVHGTYPHAVVTIHERGIQRVAD